MFKNNLSFRVFMLLPVMFMLVYPLNIVSAQQAEAAVTYSQRTAAVNRAKQYLALTPFSKAGLVSQLRYEGYSQADAEYATRHVGANWNAQAYAKGKQYLKLMPFSKEGLRQQLIVGEKFTAGEAGYAVRHLFPASQKTPAKKPAPAPKKNWEAKRSYSKTEDVCVAYSDDMSMVRVSRGTSCAFAESILDMYYNGYTSPGMRNFTSLIRMNAYSPVTKKTYPAKCQSRHTRDKWNRRMVETVCYSGQNFRAKIVYTMFPE